MYVMVATIWNLLQIVIHDDEIRAYNLGHDFCKLTVKLKLNSQLPKKFVLFTSMWEPFKNDENCFLRLRVT